MSALLGNIVAIHIAPVGIRVGEVIVSNAATDRRAPHPRRRTAPN